MHLARVGQQVGTGGVKRSGGRARSSKQVPQGRCRRSRNAVDLLAIGSNRDVLVIPIRLASALKVANGTLSPCPPARWSMPFDAARLPPKDPSLSLGREANTNTPRPTAALPARLCVSSARRLRPLLLLRSQRRSGSAQCGEAGSASRLPLSATALSAVTRSEYSLPTFPLCKVLHSHHQNSGRRGIAGPQLRCLPEMPDAQSVECLK